MKNSASAFLLFCASLSKKYHKKGGARGTFCPACLIMPTAVTSPRVNESEQKNKRKGETLMETFCTINLTFEQLNTVLTALRFEIDRAKDNGNEQALNILTSAQTAVQNFTRA